MPKSSLPPALSEHQLELRLELSSDVPPLISPYMERMRRCVQTGWQIWQNQAHSGPVIYAKAGDRSRASLIYDLVSDLLNEEFSSEKGFKLSKDRGFLTMVLPGEGFIVRFKKLDKKLRTCSSHTKQHKLYFSKQMVMKELGVVTPLVLGYKLNSTKTDIEKLCLTHQQDRSVIWSYDMGYEPSQEQPSEQPAPRRRVQIQPKITPPRAEKQTE